MKVLFCSAPPLFLHGFKEQLQGEKLIARGHKIIIIKLILLLP